MQHRNYLKITAKPANIAMIIKKISAVMFSLSFSLSKNIAIAVAEENTKTQSPIHDII